MCKLPAKMMRILAVACSLLLAGCFDIREEVWISADGSGRARLAYSFPASAARMAGGEATLETKIRELVARQPELRLDGLEVRTEGDRATVEAEISTDSVFSLRNLKKGEEDRDMPAAAADLAGDFDVQMRGWNVDFSRTIRVREALGLASLAVGKDERAKRRLRYIVHLPEAAIESNADTISNGGRTLAWDSTLGDALGRPLVTRFKARMPVPPALWFAAGLVVLALTVLLLRLRRRARA